MIAKCCEVAEVEVNSGVITHQPLPLTITPESPQVNCLHWLLLLKIHWNIMAGIPCFWLCVFRYPLVLWSSYFLVLRRGIFPFVGSPRIDWTSNSCFFPLLLFTKKRKLLLFLTKYPHQQQPKCFCLATATNEEKAKKQHCLRVWKSLCGQFSQTRCDRKLLARGKNYHFIARNNCCFFSTLVIVWIQNQNLHHKVRVCIFVEEWSGVATKFCLLVIYSRARWGQQQNIK